MNLNNLAKFSTTRSVVRPFCDSWGLCKYQISHGSLYGRDH